MKTKNNVTDYDLQLMKHEEETLDNILQCGLFPVLFPNECQQMLDIKRKIEDWILEQGE